MIMIEFFEIFLTAGFWAATIRIACPLILATLGEVLCERAGVLNLGIEGIMSIGAMVGWMTVFVGADLYTGILADARDLYCIPRSFTACNWHRNYYVSVVARFFYLQINTPGFYYTTKN